MGIAILILSSLLAAAFIAVMARYCFIGLRAQVKLYNSIQLVVLKNVKFHYLILAVFSILLSVLCVVIAAVPDFPTRQFLTDAYGMSRAMTSMAFVSLALVWFSVAAPLFLMYFSRAAVVDRGIYVSGRFIDWHRLYYYYVDEDKHNFILSVNKKGPYALKGVFGPYRFDRIDEEKIKFILTKNRNRFLTHYDIR
ncbi:MAG: hypothetical protein LBL66_01640, partial [Clostridiales bacterium]|jgi:hypothetical protein|nr:hypothetical protein [Clostridiales bacterium]